MKPWIETPITPPVPATARIVSSSLLRTRSSIAFAFAWVRNTGLPDASAASRAVRSPQCDRSMPTPTRFISATSARPKRVRPPPRSSRQPSPAGLASLYVSCAIRSPSAWKPATRARLVPNGALRREDVVGPAHEAPARARRIDALVPRAEALQRRRDVVEHVRDGHVGGG